MKKLFLIVMLSLVLIASKFNINASSNEENLTINGEEITYYKTNEKVTIPTTYQNELFEMRGMWVATVWNGDFKTVGSVNAYKQQFIKILNNLEKNNFNTILFQIRPSNDAFYISKLNPFSEWMTGIQGRSIKDTDGTVFDPLAWMIEETHKRNMQFIGWMNAYRVSARTLFTDNSNAHSKQEVLEKVTQAIESLDDLNFAKKYPRYVLLGDHDSKLILNPGEPMVRKHLVDSIEEIVRNYDIDGVHFDDYFYLDSSNASKAEALVATEEQYKNADTAFNDYYNDYQTYVSYSLPNETLGNFRRRSVNLMIEDISNMIKTVNEELDKKVQFGSKPAAVWTAKNRSVSGRIEGANVLTYSYSSYYDIFADSLHWAEEGWVDWIAPQIYFNYTNQEVPYADIVKWWAEAITKANQNLKELGKKEVRLYIAHGAYRMSSDEPVEKQITDDTELMKQLLYNKKFDVIKGSAFYDYSTYFKNSTLQENTRKNVSKLFALKSIPFENENCDLRITDYKVSTNDNKKTITITNEFDDSFAYALYSNDSLKEVKYLSDEVVEFNVLDTEDYKIYEIDKDFNVSSDFINASKNNEIICLDIYQGDEVNISSTLTIDTNSNEKVIKYNDGKITGLSRGFSKLVFKDEDKTITYYVNVYSNHEYLVNITNNDGYQIEVLTLKPYKENKDLVIKVKILDHFNNKNGILKVNDENINISNYQSEFTINLGKITKDFNILLEGIKKDKYLVIIDNGGKITSEYVEYDCDVTLPEPNESYGNKFIGWSNDGKNITKETTIKAMFSSDTLKVYFETNGGEEIDHLEFFYLDEMIEVIPVKEGHKFIGWFTDEALTIPYEYGLVKDDITLYASWEKVSGCNNALVNIFNIFSILIPIGFIKVFRKH